MEWLQVAKEGGRDTGHSGLQVGVLRQHPLEVARRVGRQDLCKAAPQAPAVGRRLKSIVEALGQRELEVLNRVPIRRGRGRLREPRRSPKVLPRCGGGRGDWGRSTSGAQPLQVDANLLEHPRRTNRAFARAYG